MTRTSLVEQYNNRDVVAQIYRLISLVESSTITSVKTEKRGNAVVLILGMYDGTEQRFHFNVDGIKDITTLQNGSVETIWIYMDSGKVYTFTFDIAIAGMTTDTVQEVTATKHFTVPQRFSGGIDGPLQIEGTTVIDGEVQVSNGHSLAVAGDVECANAVNSESAEIGNLAIEPNGNKTVLSNENGITITGTTTVNVPTNNPGIRDTKAVNGTRVENSLDAYAHMVRTTGDQTMTGKTIITNELHYNENYDEIPFITLKSSKVDVTVPSEAYQRVGRFRFADKNDVETARIEWYRDVNDQNVLSLNIRASDGTNGWFRLVMTPTSKRCETNLEKPSGW